MSNFNELNLSPLKEFKQAMENAERRGRVEELNKFKLDLKKYYKEHGYFGYPKKNISAFEVNDLIEKRLLELEKGELK